MRNKCFLLAGLALVSTSTSLYAQEERFSSSLYLKPVSKPNVSLSFSTADEGKRFAPTWGLDQAWINEQNLRKGINHMGKENIGVGRSAFRMTKPLINDSALQSDQINYLRQRSNMFNLVSTTLPLILTADQEAGSDTYFVTNSSADVDHWAANINSHVHWMQANTQHPIIAVSPFNEPDYWTVEEGATVSKHAQVANILKKNYPRMADVAMVGGNTLNDDKAWNWFSAGQTVYDWGNTHQLAGSFDSYASFHQKLAELGKVGYNDEMHNVAEAMIGLEYGMTIGIWWAFDSRARGEFCQFSRNGNRLAYGEHRTNWTAASVYRHDDGRVKAFVGSSERQAATTTFQLVSTDKMVYYDGYGPVHEYLTTMPGGTGYQNGQTNAERVIDVTWGEDVAPSYISSGVYKIVNYYTGGAITNTGSGNTVTQSAPSSTNTKQQWTMAPATNRTGGDLSFYDIEAIDNAKLRMNVKNYSMTSNAEVIVWSQDNPTTNEQWYLEYAGNGCYYIRNRESALYLSSAGTAMTARVVQKSLQNAGTNARLLQQWRLLPVDVAFEKNAPAAPAGLTAVAQKASIKLSWNANTENDVDGYMVLRSKKGTDDWNTIARNLHTTYFIDNTCSPATPYLYKVKAIDKAQNISNPSDAVEAASTGEHGMIARWQLEDNLYDDSENMMDAAHNASPKYMTEKHQGNKSLFLSSNNYMQLPYGIANSDELTVTMWVKWMSTVSWQRLFDFGNDTDHYLFLTPSNGSAVTFAIKNGDAEQTVKTSSKLPNNQWKHVAVTIGSDKTVIYVDGVEAASSDLITIRPSDIHPVLNYIGRSQFLTDPSLSAYVDDIRIFNYALPAEEVKAVMDDTYTGIMEISTDREEERPSVYSLDGKQLQTPQKGVNVINGRLVIHE